ncbi:hypothetical protein MQX03_18560 [Chryseobacterium aahli]|uniref:hypothetical protein n=1 Tax=Chryseobacterium aahli TaxID=1278643 RepID=UPI001F61A603|nr:hypothetical protein [Chryseobacterium aahli]MCI3939180.1 hypothetical protein [Chryseobacterium aahli]
MKQLLTFLLIFILLSCYKSENRIKKSEKLKDKVSYKNDKVEIKINQTNFQETIYQIVKYYNAKDFTKLNKLINPNLGIYFIYRIGTVDLWKNDKQICVSSSCKNEISVPYWYREAISKQKTGHNFKLDTVKTDVVIECDSISKKGLFFVNNKKAAELLSNTIENYIISISYDNTEESKKDIAKFKQEIKPIQNWERDSRRIVLSYKTEDNYFGNTFIFYVTEIEGRWYLSIIDFVSTDCSV